MKNFIQVFDVGGGVRDVEFTEGGNRVSGNTDLTALSQHLAEHAAILGTPPTYSRDEYVLVKDAGGGIRQVPVVSGVKFISSDSNTTTYDGHVAEHTAMDDDAAVVPGDRDFVKVYDSGGGIRNVPVINSAKLIEGNVNPITCMDHNAIHAVTSIPPGLEIPSTGRTLLARLVSSLILDEGTGNPTWSRATAAWRFNELGLLRSVPSGCAVFGGARLIRNNVTYSEDVSNAAWTKSNCTTPTATSIVCANSTTLQRVYVGNASFTLGSKLLLKCRLTYVDHPFIQIKTHGNISNEYVNFNIQAGTYTVGGSATAMMTLVSPGVYDCVAWINVTGTTAGAVFTVIFANSLASTVDPSFVGDGIKSFGITRIQSHDVTGYASTYVPEYVSAGVVATPFFGAGIDGAKYFTTDQYGAPLSGASLLGFRRENAATNNLLWNRDLSNVAWTKTNVTAALTATGLDGIANTATTLTATTNDATILQAITLASAARCASAYVRRKIGTGAISFTQDGGSTWTDITSKLNASTFTRVEITSTLANPSVGFKISTSGDAIEVDGVQNEAGAVATSLILTTTAAVTRNAESLTYQVSGNVDFSVGTVVGKLQSNLSSTSRYIAKIGSSGSYTLGSGSIWSINWRSYDGTNILDKPLSDVSTATRKRASSWGPAGLKTAGDGLAPSSRSFDGTFGDGATIDVGYGINGTIRDVAIYNYQMTDAEMMSITT